MTRGKSFTKTFILQFKLIIYDQANEFYDDDIIKNDVPLSRWWISQGNESAATVSASHWIIIIINV